MVNLNVEHKLTLSDAMARVLKLLNTGRNIDISEYFAKISKLMREVKRLSDSVESKDLELYTMPGLVEEAGSLQKEVSTLKEEKGCLVAANKVVLSLGTGISALKATTGSLVLSLQEVKVRSVEVERDLKKY